MTQATQITAEALADLIANGEGMELIKAAMAMAQKQIAADRLTVAMEEEGEEPPTQEQIAEYAYNFWNEMASADFVTEVGELIQPSQG